MEVRVLRWVDVDSILDGENARGLVDSIANAFRDFSLGRAVMPQRTVFYLDDDWWGVMPCGLRGSGVAVKVVNVISRNASRGLPTTQGLVLLFDDETGTPRAVINGTALTAWRTAAATAVSIRYLARDTDSIAIIGAGLQARYHAVLFMRVFNVRKFIINSRTREKALKLAEFIRSRGFDAVVVDSVEDAVRGADVIVAATTNKTPVIMGEWLVNGQHVASIGAPERDARELNDEVLRRSRRLFVDSRKAVINETGDVIIPMNNRLIDENYLIEIGEVIANIKPGRTSDDEITVFKSVGIAAEDLAASVYIYNLAVKSNIGVTIEL
ncbi:ornithine cyclodeaminase family protein [Vulcanisaeta thermophila]|uniref:ornithine cyclodeaminase family protein n=1 Tax=Vulcanisaeta thermophila TaxID=867917 RepID=UPI000853158A|nr:ornithine cyclodeaminase family protein [Vulcanisaeta thermophila]